MLQEYIEAYKKAMKNKDEKDMYNWVQGLSEKEMKRIEKDRAQLGMDRMTLMLLVKEV